MVLGPLGIERIHIRGPNESFGKEDGAKQLFAFAFAGVPALEPILHPIIQGGTIFGGGTTLAELFELFVGVIRNILPHACRDLFVEFHGNAILLDFLAFGPVIRPIGLLALCGAVPGRIATRTLLGLGFTAVLVLAEVEVGRVWRFLDLLGRVNFLHDSRIEKWIENRVEWKRLSVNTDQKLLAIAADEVQHVVVADPTRFNRRG